MMLKKIALCAGIALGVATSAWAAGGEAHVEDFDFWEISELDINPMLALEVGEKPVVLDARVKLKTID